jgi:hypothetical protein
MSSSFSYIGHGSLGCNKGTADASLRHVAETWQAWAFLYGIVLTIAFALIDALAEALIKQRLGGWASLVGFGLKAGVAVLFWFTFMVWRGSRRRLLRWFDRHVIEEQLQ